MTYAYKKEIIISIIIISSNQQLIMNTRARIGYEVIDSQRGAWNRVGFNHIISNKHEWNNWFITNAPKNRKIK